MGLFKLLFGKRDGSRSSSRKKKASSSSLSSDHVIDLFQTFSSSFIHDNMLKFLTFDDVMNLSLVSTQFRSLVLQLYAVGIRIDDEEKEEDVNTKKQKKKKIFIDYRLLSELPFENVVKVQVFGRPVNIPKINWKCVKKLYFDVHYYHEYYKVSDIINSALETNRGTLSDVCIHNTKFPNDKLTVSRIIQGVNQGFCIRKLETSLETDFFDLLKRDVVIKYLFVKANFFFEEDFLEGNVGLCKVERFKCAITHENLKHFKKLITFPEFQPEVLELCISNQISHALPEILKLCNRDVFKRIILSDLDGCFVWHTLSTLKEEDLPKCEIDMSFCTPRVDSLTKFKQNERIQSLAIAVHEQQEIEKLVSTLSTGYKKLIHLMITCENPHIYNDLVSSMSKSFHLIHAHQIVMFKRFNSQGAINSKKVYESCNRLRKFTMLKIQEKVTTRRCSADNQEIKIVEDVLPSAQWKHYKKPTIKILNTN